MVPFSRPYTHTRRFLDGLGYRDARNRPSHILWSANEHTRGWERGRAMGLGSGSALMYIFAGLGLPLVGRLRISTINQHSPNENLRVGNLCDE